MTTSITENPILVFDVGDVLRKLRTEKGWSLEQLAEASGVDKMTISKFERGLSDTRRSTVDALARALGLSGEAELHAIARDLPRHTGTGEHDEAEPFDRDISRGYKKHDVPVIGDAEATTNGIISWSDEGIVKTQVEEWVSRAFSNGDPLAYALRVRGDSMVPRYLPGEVVIVQPRIPPRDGDFAVVQLKNGERLVKRVFKTSTGWVLRSMNEAYPPREVSLEEVHAVHVIKHSVARM